MCYCNNLPTDIAWLHLHCVVVFVPRVIKNNHMDLLPKLAVDPVPAKVPAQDIVPASLAAAAWTGGCFINLLVSRPMHKCLN